METTIKNVEDLNKKGGTEGGIKYGCVTDQSTASFFQVNLFWSPIDRNNQIKDVRQHFIDTKK